MIYPSPPEVSELGRKAREQVGIDLWQAEESVSVMCKGVVDEASTYFAYTCLCWRLSVQFSTVLSSSCSTNLKSNIKKLMSNAKKDFGPLSSAFRAMDYRDKMAKAMRMYQLRNTFDKLTRVDQASLHLRMEAINGVSRTELWTNTRFRIVEAHKTDTTLYLRSQYTFTNGGSDGKGNSDVIWDRELFVIQPKMDWIVIQTSNPLATKRTKANSLLTEWFTKVRIRQ